MDANGALVDLFDASDAWHFFEEVAFDAHLEGHGGGWTANAGPEELDEDGAVGPDADEFEVAAVGLDGRPNAFEDRCDLWLEVAGRFGGRGGHGAVFQA